ncbi:Uncharacterised protein [uncultured Clostridium sp.]|nr:Uncharacterised protein [uncultured Clostridium sp.]SCI95164.1 Uncharacterised protein [uncultured Clostridium sp.]
MTIILGSLMIAPFILATGAVLLESQLESINEQ